MHLFTNIQRTLLAAFAASLLFVPALRADAVVDAAPGESSAKLPKGLEGVKIEQRLNAMVPLDIDFLDEQGKHVQLGDYFGKKPVVLALVYYECPMLCTLELNGLLRALRAMPLNLGQDFEIVTVSFDPGETPELATKKKAEYVKQYGRPGVDTSWHFLTGQAGFDQETHRGGRVSAISTTPRPTCSTTPAPSWC